MADAAGLCLSIAVLVKDLYEYGRAVKGAQEDIVALTGELAAIKSILDLYLQQAAGRVPIPNDEFAKMVQAARTIVRDLADQMRGSQSSVHRKIQSLKWPFVIGGLREKFSRLERLKSWFLLTFLVSSNLDIQNVRNEMRALSETIQVELEERRTTQRSSVTAELRAIVSPYSSSNVHWKACQSWQGSESGLWFCNAHLARWLGDAVSPRTMILSGGLGAGKTTLMSRAIQHTTEIAIDHADLCVAYSYCSYDERDSQDVRSILGSWVVQIPAALDHINTNATKAEDISVAELEKHLTTAAEEYRLVLFLDAVNESLEGIEEILKSISRLTAVTRNIRFVISTTTSYIQAVKNGFNTPLVEVRMSLAVMMEDIEAYIRARVTSNKVLCQISPVEFVAALLYQSEGMFRWVSCQMTYLSAQLTARHVRRALRSLPGTLNEIYAYQLSLVPQASRQMIHDTLLWLSFCHRPLTLDELCEAIIIEEEDEHLDDACRLQEPETLLSLCQGLVVLDLAANTVSLAHSSVKDFLTGGWISTSSVSFFAMDSAVATRFILRKCLTYLQLQDLQLPAHDFDESLDDILLDIYPFLGYACTRWAVHAKTCDLKNEEWSLILQFFSTQQRQGGGSFAFWISCLYSESERERLQIAIQTAEPLYYAASYNLSKVIERLFAEGYIDRADPTAPWYIDHTCGRNDSTALQVACYRGHGATVDVLLREGADPESEDCAGITCVQWAIIRGHLDIVAKLRIAGANVPWNVRQYPLFESDDEDENRAEGVPYTGFGHRLPE